MISYLYSLNYLTSVFPPNPLQSDDCSHHFTIAENNVNDILHVILAIFHDLHFV